MNSFLLSLKVKAARCEAPSLQTLGCPQRSPREPSEDVMGTSEKIPLFIPKTGILSQRSSGYVNTHSAVNEFIDNSIEAGAKHVYVYYLPHAMGSGFSHTTSSCSMMGTG
jgi:hypothetical protein